MGKSVTTEQALSSVYIIDGIQQELTPLQMLESVGMSAPQSAIMNPIVDESLDPPVAFEIPDKDRAEELLDSQVKNPDFVPLPFAAEYSRIKLMEALIDAMWREGHFRLGDLSISPSWVWNAAHLGSQAAFYSSVRAVCDFTDSLGLTLGSYSLKHTRGQSFLDFTVNLNPCDDDDIETPYRTVAPIIRKKRLCPGELLPIQDSWIVYIPFDTSDYRLGGSLLSRSLAQGGGVAPSVDDADYFIDCFEVLRELVEDKVVLAASTVGRGGLLPALKSMIPGGTGADIDISGIIKASGEKNICRILFSEVPGVIIQIQDIDFDYLDAELILQDVAYYPLGHPVLSSMEKIRLNSSARSGIQTILDSLLQNAEGED